MALTQLTPTRITLDGVTLPAGAAGDVANGNVVEGNDGKSLLVVVANTSADTPYDVTFVTPGEFTGGYAIEDKVVEMAASSEKWFGPFPLDAFSHDLQITVENAALTLLAVKVN